MRTGLVRVRWNLARHHLDSSVRIHPHPQRRRLEAFAARLARDGQHKVNKPGELIRDALLAELSVCDPILNENAMRALSQLEELDVDHLISEAVRHPRNRGYCLKQLQAIERMGRRLNEKQNIDLLNMYWTNQSEEIREQVLKVLVASRRCPA